MVRSLGVVSFLGALALAASVVPAANRGVPSGSGDKFTADISSAADTDSYVLRLGEGGTLTVKAAALKSALLPTVTLKGPDGVVVSTTLFVKGDGTAKYSINKFPLDETGLWQVNVTGRTAGPTGAYTVAFTYKPPKALKVKAAGIPATGETFFRIAGDDGALLAFKVKEKDKLAPPLTAVRAVTSANVTVVPQALYPIVHKGTSWSGKKILLAQGLGNYGIGLTGSGVAATPVDVTLSVKLAKRVKQKLILGVEPDPQDLDPSFGRDGVAVVVTGTNFSSPGAKVYFGEAEATGVVVGAPGPAQEIQCVAPLSTESDLGKSVPVYVENLDGQGNSVPFQYHGTPGPSTVSPTAAPLAGGITFTITGNNSANRFVAGGDYEVTVRGQAAVVVGVATNVITCTAPNLGTPGAADIVVTDPYGRSGPTITGLVYVSPPDVDSASPDSVSFQGGRTITLTGTGFRTTDEVFVAGVEVTPVSVPNSTTLTFAMPAGVAGAFSLEVKDEFNQSSGVLANFLRRRGPFENRTSTAVPAGGVGVEFFASTLGFGDLDGDAVPDLVVTSRYETDYGTSFVLLNDGAGVFTNETATHHATFSLPGDAGQAAAIALGDMDGDPGNEVVMAVRDPFVGTDPFQYYAAGPIYYAYAVYSGATWAFDLPTYTSTRILSNDGAGYLADDTAARMPAPVSTPLLGAGERFQAADAALGDLDGDNSPDLVLVSPFVFQGTVDSLEYYADHSYLDGTYDTYVAFQSNFFIYVPATRILLNDGAGAMTQMNVMPAVTYFADEFTAKEACGADAVAVGDVDGDDDLDLVITQYPAPHYDPSGASPLYYLSGTRVLLNNGDATAFTVDTAAMPATYASTHPGTKVNSPPLSNFASRDNWQGHAVALGDLDDDGDLDIVIGRHVIRYWTDAGSAKRLTPAVRMFRNDGDGDFAEDTGGFLPNSSFLGNSMDTVLGVSSIQIGDLDGDGSNDVVLTGTYYGVDNYNASGYGPFGILPAGDRPATRVLLNDGAGAFADVTTAWLPAVVDDDYFQANVVRVGDLDDDGDPDLVLGYETYPDADPYGTTYYNRPLRVLRNK